MRKLIIILCIAGVAFFAFGPVLRSRARHFNADGGVIDMPAIETPRVVFSMPKVAMQRPTIQLSKRKSDREPGYTVKVDGYAPSEEEARKDAFSQASKTIMAALDIKHAIIDESRLAKMITDCQDNCVDLGTSDGKELGTGKQVSMTLELVNDFIRDLLNKERTIRMEKRMEWLTRGLAVMVAGLFAISSYLRLDEWSKGYVSGVLKMVAIFVVIAAGFGIYYW